MSREAQLLFMRSDSGHDHYVVTTLIACRPDLESQERWTLDLLRARPTLALSGSVLVLGHGDVVAQFLDQATQSPSDR